MRLPKGADIVDVSRSSLRSRWSATRSQEPLRVDAPTPRSYVPFQVYRLPRRPDGINVAAASGVAGGTGNRVDVIDIENGWNTDQRSAAARGGFIANGTPWVPVQSHVDHGTAVLGQLIGADNGFGVSRARARMRGSG